MDIFSKVTLAAMVLASLWTVMARSLIRAALGLALTSALLAIVMFRLSCPLAAVFELSVCTGLISVLFISTISITEPLSRQEVLERMKEKMSRFWYLPLVVVLAAIFLFLLHFHPAVSLPTAEAVDVRSLLWNSRQLDILGQIILLLAGVFGVVIFFKESRRDAN